LNQLTKETLTDGTTITYEYDAVGNRTKKIVNNGTATTTTTYTYDAANQLTAVNGQAYTYDVNGNLTNNGNKIFVYDDDNRLIEVKNTSGVTIASFTYDHQGRRNSKTTSNGTIYYQYDGDSNRVLYETDANNNIVAEYTWDAYGYPVTMTKGGVTYYYHKNGHGDVTALTDENGNVVAQYQYDAWGNIISKTGTMASANPYRYAGYYYDEETGLYYLMSRYYNSEIGRFINSDNPLVIKTLTDEALKAPGEYQGLPLLSNLFVYAANNPVMYVDPSGYAWGNHWWNSRWFVVNAINWGITAIVGGGLGGLSLYLRNLAKKYTAQRAKVIFSDSLKRKLLAKGVSARIASYVANAANVLFNLLMWATDPGTKIFNHIDSRDHRKNNGYLNL
jgi:RHS repeat-associated protein